MSRHKFITIQLLEHYLSIMFFFNNIIQFINVWDFQSFEIKKHLYRSCTMWKIYFSHMSKYLERNRQNICILYLKRMRWFQWITMEIAVTGNSVDIINLITFDFQRNYSSFEGKFMFYLQKSILSFFNHWRFC